MSVFQVEPTTRPSLLIRLKDARDDEAWGDFTAIYEPVIYAMTRRRGFQDADAREIVQEVFLSVSRSIEKFDASQGGSFRGWLSRITKNATIDRLRKVDTQPQPIDDAGIAKHLDRIAASARSDAEFDRDRRYQLFRWASAEVRRRTGETNWMAFWRSSVDGQSIPTVAADLGIDEGSVYVARCRIIKRIRELVDDRMAE